MCFGYKSISIVTCACVHVCVKWVAESSTRKIALSRVVQGASYPPLPPEETLGEGREG